MCDSEKILDLNKCQNYFKETQY